MHLSFWQHDAFLQPADVVIAGGGFMGLWSAYQLKLQYPNLRVTILERESLPGGASVRNAGFACFGSPGELLVDAAAMGNEALWQVVEMRYRGINKIRNVLGDDLIDYDNCGGYECFTNQQQFEVVADKLYWLNQEMKVITGKKNVFTITDSAIAKNGMKKFLHMIANPLEGGLHSGKTIRALLQKLTAMDVTILTGIAVKSWQRNNYNISIELSGTINATLLATTFLITTNAFAPQLAGTVPVQPARGQILLTKPIDGLALRGTFHYDEGFYYWRNVGNRILLGGARNQAFDTENTTDINTSDTVQQALKSFLHHHVDVPPHLIQIDYQWSGIMGFTQNKLPVIQQIEPGVWAAIVCNGMGVALAPVLAEQVVTQMMG